MNRPYFIHDFNQDGDPNETPWAEIALALNRPEQYQGDDGFLIRIWGGDIHPSKNWIAWVDLHARTTNNWIENRYFFRIKVDDKQVFEWEVETYNPAFGTGTVYLHWHDDNIIYIYTEKHDMYGVTATTSEIKHRVRLAVLESQIRVDDDIVRVIPMDIYKGFLKQYRLPDWEKLDPPPEAKAREMGLLED